MKLCLAADSGGSKTLWRVLNEKGELLRETRTGGMGAVREGLLPVEEIAAAAARELAEYPVSSVYLSLGGPNTGEVERALRSFWRDVPVKVEREANGNAMLRAAAFHGCGAVILCGTGSTAVGTRDGKRRYAGGWGPTYGDEGSGGGLGKDALWRYLRAMDGPGEESALAALFPSLTEGLDPTEFSGRMELKRRALALSRGELAALAPRIYAMALAGEREALELIRNSAREIARLAALVSEPAADTRVLLCGGYFTDKALLLEECRAFFRELSPGELVYMPEFGPIAAAEAAALEEAGIRVTEEIYRRILEKRSAENE